MAINDALPLKAIIAKLNFWGFESELQTNPVPFHLDSPSGRHVDAASSVCDGLWMEQNTKSGKNLWYYFKPFVDESL